MQNHTIIISLNVILGLKFCKTISCIQRKQKVQNTFVSKKFICETSYPAQDKPEVLIKARLQTQPKSGPSPARFTTLVRTNTYTFKSYSKKRMLNIVRYNCIAINAVVQILNIFNYDGKT